MKQKPACLLMLPVWLARGRASFQQQVARRVALDAAALPYRHDLLTYIQERRTLGRTIVLATDADAGFARPRARLGHGCRGFVAAIIMDHGQKMSGGAGLRRLPWLRRSLVAVTSLLGFAMAGVGGFSSQVVPLENQAAEYRADVAKTIVELQQFRQMNSIPIRSREDKEGVATLINLNPATNVWYVLKLEWKDGGPAVAYHLENPRPGTSRLLLDESHPSALWIEEGSNRYACDLFGSVSVLGQARGSRLIYSPLCDSRVYLRNAAVGHRTTIEAATEFLRNQVWGGELVIDFGHHLVGDLHRETGEIERAGRSVEPGDVSRAEGPRPADINPASRDEMVTSTKLGIRLAGRPEGSPLSPGAWYAAEGNRGIYVSVLRPDLIAPQILRSDSTVVRPLDPVEASALCFVVAFDLDQFDLAYARGTEHPAVGWSAHIQPQMRIPSLPGPDGIGSIAPLVSTGLVNPEEVTRIIATFTGGFKREQGAFKSGALARQNHGTHYGFIEQGVVFSKLQPGLATVVVLDDGSIVLKTWRETDNSLLDGVKFARQNGVPLIDFDETTRSSAPGALVGQWGPGNWSGSENEKLRTIRGGLAVQNVGRKQFLLYAVFTDATPSAMARVFQAYLCRYAMLIDMNALEHTYLAIYRRSGSHVEVDHLIEGMAQVDRLSGGQVIPRFVGYPDNRDFFYVLGKPEPGRRR